VIPIKPINRYLIWSYEDRDKNGVLRSVTYTLDAYPNKVFHSKEDLAAALVDRLLDDEPELVRE